MFYKAVVTEPTAPDFGQQFAQTKFGKYKGMSKEDFIDSIQYIQCHRFEVYEVADTSLLNLSENTLVELRNLNDSIRKLLYVDYLHVSKFYDNDILKMVESISEHIENELILK